MSHAVCVRGLKLCLLFLNKQVFRSHAVCVRGLKLCLHLLVRLEVMVARRVRAWIETNKLKYELKNIMSHAVCVRGLKHF